MTLALDKTIEAGERTLYVNRPLRNAADLIAWAKAAGFKKTLPASDVHVTIAFSKTPVEWAEPNENDLFVGSGGMRKVEPLGDKGAVVLRFESQDLTRRWHQFCAGGASWDYPEYRPHVTITYDGAPDLSGVEPYTGPLEFGPESFSEIDSGWHDKVTSDSALRLALDRASVREYTRDGHLKVIRTHVSKANVCPYKGSEIPEYAALGLDPGKIYQLLRDPEELAKAAPTLNGVPLLRIHKPVHSGDHPKVDTVGAVGTSAEFDGEYLDNAIVIWTQDDIDAVDSNKKRELSAGYHYTPDMTPGIFRGKAFDGVMRDIEFNHVALVEDGRAGPDVVVGDSTENLPMKATRFGALALSLTAAHVAPLLAMDSKGVTLPKDLFRGITPKNFKDKKTELLSGVKLAVDGKLRKGLAYDEAPLMRLLDALQDTATDEPVSEKVEEALEKEVEEGAAVEPVGVLPAPIAEKTKAFDAEPVKQFCREKGMSEDDITALSGMFPQPATDEFPPAKKDGEEDDDEAKKKAEAEKAKAKDAAMKDMVSKPAMDAAITAATAATAKSVRETERGIAQAREHVEPWVGKLPLSLALDSAADVYRHAATMLNIPDAKTLHADALFPIIRSQRKPGARAAETLETGLGMDAAAVKGFGERFPDAGRIQPA